MSSSPGKKIKEEEVSAGREEPTLPLDDQHAPPKVGSLKRPASSLLPALVPLSSSPPQPQLHRPHKRQARIDTMANWATISRSRYLTPAPTSSIGIPSSPSMRSQPDKSVKMSIEKCVEMSIEKSVEKSVQERAPLATVPSIHLDEGGQMLLMGRSSNASHYQLSISRLVSRVHVKARYVATDPAKVEVYCNGPNGMKVQCQGKTFAMDHGDSFTTMTENADVMVDVQGARVLLHWPRKADDEFSDHMSDSSWDDEHNRRSRSETPTNSLTNPMRRHTRAESPGTPSPVKGPSPAPVTDLDLDLDDDAPLQIYEDGDDGEQAPSGLLSGPSLMDTQPNNSFSSDLSDIKEDGLDGDNDSDMENTMAGKEHMDAQDDQFLLSFGAFMPMPPHSPRLSHTKSAKVSANSEDSAKVFGNSEESAKVSDKSKVSHNSEEASSKTSIDRSALTNHVVNQIAYGRGGVKTVSSIMNNLPAEDTSTLSKLELHRLITSIPCIGTIERQGKDAAGKPLESEYYYQGELDDDEERRVAVTDGLKKPSLRACRRQHKQYYWKPPKTS